MTLIPPSSASLDSGFPPAPHSIILAPLAARTASVTVEFSTGLHRNVEVVLQSTVQAGAGLTLSVQGYDPMTNTWDTIGTATILNAAGYRYLLIGPDVVASANVDIKRLIRNKLRAVCTVTDATSYTWGLSVHAG